ncbi:MAG: hypothetical protein MUF57_04680, partial [Gammaproteobacteria bacterium]|nr:hypothetical protein [Gammaproteobacteria bacterium]
VAAVLAAVAALALWAWLGREIPLPDAPGGKLQCLSYTPYREGQTPFDKEFVAPRAQVEEDLTKLAAATHCVRTYSSAQGLDAVAEIAPAHGLDVLLGIWIGRTPKENAREIEAALAAAQAHPAAIKALVVGNETLLRRELTAAQLIEYIDQVRARTPLPLTYADVWEFWLQNPQVAEHVDFITVHILPYWEDLPVSIESSLAHVQVVLDEVKAAFPGKRILVGETGWPSEGRSREAAVPSRVNQARFVREFVQLAQRNDVRYNLIEAFDQPWKRKLEGTVGGFWGLFSEQRNAKWPLVGPVSEYPRWQAAALLASATALVLLVWGLLRGLELSLGRWVAFALVGAALGFLLVLQLRLAVAASKHFPEWAFYLTLIFTSGVAWLTLALKAVAPLSGWAKAAFRRARRAAAARPGARHPALRGRGDRRVAGLRCALPRLPHRDLRARRDRLPRTRPSRGRTRRGDADGAGARGSDFALRPRRARGGELDECRGDRVGGHAGADRVAVAAAPRAVAIVGRKSSRHGSVGWASARHRDPELFAGE